MNANSLYNKYSRYVAGGTTEHKNSKLEWWEKTEFQRDASDTVYTVENFYVSRLDLLASAFYGESRYWWIIAQYNNILDPINEVTAGRVLLIPSKERIPLMLLSKQGGKESEKQDINVISPIVI